MNPIIKRQFCKVIWLELGLVDTMKHPPPPPPIDSVGAGDDIPGAAATGGGHWVTPVRRPKS